MKFYEPVHGQFEKFCKARVYGEMEHGDLINESLLVAYKKFESLKNPEKLLSFLIGTAIRILSNSHKKKKAETGIIDINRSKAESADKADSSLEVRMLYEAIAKLPAEQKESIVLFEITGYSIKEIAKLHGVGESAVKQRLRRARLKLQEILDVQPKNESTYG